LRLRLQQIEKEDISQLYRRRRHSDIQRSVNEFKEQVNKFISSFNSLMDSMQPQAPAAEEAAAEEAAAEEAAAEEAAAEEAAAEEAAAEEAAAEEAAPAATAAAEDEGVGMTMPDGKTEIRYANDVIERGVFVNGKLEGTGERQLADGSIQKGTFSAGVFTQTPEAPSAPAPEAPAQDDLPESIRGLDLSDSNSLTPDLIRRVRMEYTSSADKDWKKINQEFYKMFNTEALVPSEEVAKDFVKQLQRAIGITGGGIDGKIGPQTLRRINREISRGGGTAAFIERVKPRISQLPGGVAGAEEGATLAPPATDGTVAPAQPVAPPVVAGAVAPARPVAPATATGAVAVATARPASEAAPPGPRPSRTIESTSEEWKTIGQDNFDAPPINPGQIVKITSGTQIRTTSDHQDFTEGLETTILLGKPRKTIDGDTVRGELVDEQSRRGIITSGTEGDVTTITIKQDLYITVPAGQSIQIPNGVGIRTHRSL
jgi:hypothetical protein